MEALIKEICLKTGITEQQAREAVNVTVDKIKAKTPGILHSQIDKILNGESMSDAIKSKFKELSDDADDAFKNFGTKAEEFAGDVKKKIDEVFKSTR
ncbi:MAG: hypothetical protein IPJ79_02240 [Bacteroidetes bacterium]|nr:hypothetical protein [Bacteroidota bacterium]